MNRYLSEMLLSLLLTVFFLSVCSTHISAQESGKDRVIEKNGICYLANTLVIKFRQPLPAKASAVAAMPGQVQKVLKPLGVSSMMRHFSNVRDAGSSLASIMEVRYSSSDDPAEAASKLNKSGEVEWAEPHYVYKPDLLTDDPSYAEQWGLQKIMAEKAWEITQGDTAVVIGIVDTGVDWDHPDLSANIWTNYKEIPANGIDDDRNGYIDDVRGWDFGGFTGTPDNDPVEDNPDHGTHVAGIAAAVTNNAAGIASIGYKCRIMPVKTVTNNQRDMNGRPYIIYGYEGIIYAADNGARIINCSWGGSSFSRSDLEAVRYAESKGALVVCSAGNSNSPAPNYPGSFDEVLSVAATTPEDMRASFSTYGRSVDVSAPGVKILSTWMNDTYESMQGTSMAAPLVAGLAALVAAEHPDYTPLQIKELIRVNTDNIDELNPLFKEQLGSGRINAYKTLSNKKSVSVRAANISFSDEGSGGDGNGTFEAGETVSVNVEFLNVLSDLNSAAITLECSDPGITIESSVFHTGAVAAGNSFNNFSNPFRFKIEKDIRPNKYVSFILRYHSEGYSDYQWSDSVLVNPSFQTQTSGSITMTITGSGNLGYADWWNNTLGSGFRYKKGPNLLYEGAFMFGSSAEHVSDAVRGKIEQDTDFVIVDPFKLGVQGPVSDQQGYGIFNDGGAGDKKLGIETHLSSYSWSKEPYNGFIILKYNLINKSPKDIDGFYAGLFFDWNLQPADQYSDNAAYDEQYKTGYAYYQNPTSAVYTGCTLLSSGAIGFHAIENGGRDGGIAIYSGSGGFTQQEKWQTLSGGLKKTRVENGDVSFVLSSGPHSIKSGDTLEVAFAVTAGGSLDEICSSAARAREKYRFTTTGLEDAVNELPAEFMLAQNYPNPFNPETKITYQLPEAGYVSLKVYDILGKEVAALVDGFQPAGTYSSEFKVRNTGLTSGIYIYQLKCGNRIMSKKMLLLK